MLRGGGGIPSTPDLPALVIYFNVSPRIEWTFTDFDPNSWFVEQSTDGGTTWDPYDTITGLTRTYTPADPGMFRIFGVDSLGAADTQTSNVLTIP